MPAFLDDLKRFYGTGESNAQGQSLEAFLKDYDPRKYETPSCTTDAVILAYDEKIEKTLDGLSVLLVKRSNHPCIGLWALPGGFADMRENLDDTAKRELEEETGVKGLLMEQLSTYGDFDRDPRTRVITTAYMAIVQKKEVQIQAGDDAADAAWCKVSLEETDSIETAGKSEKTYRLSVWNEGSSLKTEAIVKAVETTGLIREKSFKVKEAGKIAVDHAAMIVQALITLKNRL